MHWMRIVAQTTVLDFFYISTSTCPCWVFLLRLATCWCSPPKPRSLREKKTLSVPGKLINQLCFKLNYASCPGKPNQKVQNTRLLENWRSCIKICVAHPGDVFMACWALDQAPKLVVTWGPHGDRKMHRETILRAWTHGYKKKVDMYKSIPNIVTPSKKTPEDQWSFLVPLIGGR